MKKKIILFWGTAIVCWILAITMTKERPQSLKRNFKLNPSGNQVKLFNFVFLPWFLVGISYQVHQGQYSHNIAFYKLNVHQRTGYQRPNKNEPQCFFSLSFCFKGLKYWWIALLKRWASEVSRISALVVKSAGKFP